MMAYALHPSQCVSCSHPRRAARTLAYYLSETNLNVYHWLLAFINQYPIPRVNPPLDSTLICMNKNCTLWLLQPDICIAFRSTHVVTLHSAILRKMDGFFETYALTKVRHALYRMVRGMMLAGRHSFARCCPCRYREPNSTQCATNPSPVTFICALTQRMLVSLVKPCV